MHVFPTTFLALVRFLWEGKSVSRPSFISVTAGYSLSSFHETRYCTFIVRQRGEDSLNMWDCGNNGQCETQLISSSCFVCRCVSVFFNHWTRSADTTKGKRVRMHFQLCVIWLECLLAEYWGAEVLILPRENSWKFCVVFKMFADRIRGAEGLILPMENSWKFYVVFRMLADKISRCWRADTPNGKLVGLHHIFYVMFRILAGNILGCCVGKLIFTSSGILEKLHFRFSSFYSTCSEYFAGCPSPLSFILPHGV